MGWFEDYILPYLPGFCNTKMYEVPWKIDKQHLKIIVNKNADSKMQRELENRDQQTDPAAFIHHRRVFGSYAIVYNKRAEFIQFTQVDKIELEPGEIDKLRDLRSVNDPNLVHFFGVQINDDTLSTTTFFHVLVERATLEEFCLDKQFIMDETFKSGFLRDLLHGLDYLHNKSRIKYHGYFLASTCLIDINWVLKLSLFGISNLVCKHFSLGTIRSYDNAPPMLSYHQYLCFAPEHIRRYDTTGKMPPRMVTGDDKGDIYSLGMIIYMMLERTDPFELMHSHERASSTHLLEILNENKMPRIDPEYNGGTKKSEKMLIDKCVECWNRDREMRPSIANIEKTIAEVYLSSNGTLVDQMIRQSEKLADDLEKRVDKAKRKLEKARETSMKLLNEMLPKKIAEAMTKNEDYRPPPRSYASATVMFVQVCDFPKIMKRSTPNETIRFLNDIFDHFDAVIETHDAYKVETTGETYMVASGVPEENDGRHVVEVAEMSLKIREVSYHYKLPHIDDIKINIRIGFHAGPIAAGIIGVRAPRYCLFGDTVNFASRMQSNCPPNQIQTSEQTANMLDRNEYKLVKRGIVHVKGKGEVNCYWLNEHAGHHNSGGEEGPEPVIADSTVEEPSTSGLPIPEFQMEVLEITPEKEKKVLGPQKKR